MFKLLIRLFNFSFMCLTSFSSCVSSSDIFFIFLEFSYFIYCFIKSLTAFISFDFTGILNKPFLLTKGRFDCFIRRFFFRHSFPQFFDMSGVFRLHLSTMLLRGLGRYSPTFHGYYSGNQTQKDSGEDDFLRNVDKHLSSHV